MSRLEQCTARGKKKLVRTLRWSQKYMKTDMVYLFKGGGWLTLGNILSSAATFLLAVAFANLISKELYGSYKFILSIAGILTIPTLQGMTVAVTRAVAQGNEKTIITAVKTRLRWGSLASIGSIGVAGYYFLSGNVELTFAFLIAATFLPFLDTFNTYQAYLYGKKRFGLSTKYEIVAKIIPVTLLIASIYFSGNLLLIVFTYFFSYTALRILLYHRSLKKLPPNKNIDKGAVSYGKHLSLMGVIGTIARNIDKILLFHFLGAAEVAIYAIAVAPPEQIKGVLKNVSTLVLPRFSERTSKSIKSSLLWKSLLMGGVIAVGIAIYVLIAPFVFEIFFPEYTQSVFLSQLFSLSLVSAVATLPTGALQAHKKKKELYQIEIFQPTLEIILLLFLVSSHGLLGAILSRIIGRLFNAAFSFFLFYKKS